MICCQHLRPRTIITYLLLLSLLLSCGLTNVHAKPPTPLSDHQPDVLTRTQQRFDFANFVEQLSDKRVVLVGEVHDRYEHHLNQLAVLRAMHTQSPQLAIGVEWFQQPFQKALNDWLAGRIDEETLLRQSEYYVRWGYDFRLLRPILDFAKQHNLPVIALNAPTEITRQIARSGIDSLNDTDRAQIPAVIHPPDRSYLQRLRSIFEQHAQGERQFEYFVSVQRVWEETMAANALSYLKQYPDKRMLILLGEGHMQAGGGVPDDLARDLAIDSISTVLTRPLETRTATEADYTLLSAAQSLTAKGKLGVWLTQDERGLSIKALSNSSAAAKSGLKQGDYLLKLDGQAIDDLTDLRLALRAYQAGDTVKLHIERANSTEEWHTQLIELPLR